ncbi:MAG: RAMP superfamily protein [Synechococcaceae cyanobacterium SM2_3_2]|nr:RAMP superfamily protein [Synechococcaceae cyanobacterium SM2_3_2]
MYTGPRLIELLRQQHQRRSSNLFQEGTFTLRWRAKVGSFPHPDVETLVSAGEPCGSWNPSSGRPEDKRNVGDNWDLLPDLPLNGYIPGASIRGIVRAWAKQRPERIARMEELLGVQKGSTISAGKIQFLDAWPLEPTPLSLDIVNPQQNFQVFHEGQGTPLSLYTLGDGRDPIPFLIAIRGISGATKEEVDEVWSWVLQALKVLGVGSRTASGYGRILVSGFKGSKQLGEGVSESIFRFNLSSQGNAGPNMRTMELRPSHWRGWLRSWALRFFLGVMTRENALQTVGELFGSLEPESHKGCVRLEMIQGDPWGSKSGNSPFFYTWNGDLRVEAPKEILMGILFPMIRVAVMTGGVGRGWRRPLHLFMMERREKAPIPASRGSHLTLDIKIKGEFKKVGISLDPEKWDELYQGWYEKVEQLWPERLLRGSQNPIYEAFSPSSCAVFAVPGPDQDPIESSDDNSDSNWIDPDDVESTRGDGMWLIYQSDQHRNYKRNPDLGGNAAQGNANCSWVSIRRHKTRHNQADTDCQEVVCLFMGGIQAGSQHVRSRFLDDLSRMSNSFYLFGHKT